MGPFFYILFILDTVLNFGCLILAYIISVFECNMKEISYSLLMLGISGNTLNFINITKGDMKKFLLKNKKLRILFHVIFFVILIFCIINYVISCWLIFYYNFANDEICDKTIYGGTIGILLAMFSIGSLSAVICINGQNAMIREYSENV